MLKNIFSFFSFRLKLLWLTLTQVHSCCEIEFLPVYRPSLEEKNDPRLFANNVRELMAKWVFSFLFSVAKIHHSYDALGFFFQSFGCASFQLYIRRLSSNDTSEADEPSLRRKPNRDAETASDLGARQNEPRRKYNHQRFLQVHSKISQDLVQSICENTHALAGWPHRYSTLYALR